MSRTHDVGVGMIPFAEPGASEPYFAMGADYAKKRGMRTDVRIAAQAMTTDVPATFEGHSMRRLVGCDMARDAAKMVYEAA